MAADPDLLLLDDPTTGLDPILATTVDDGIVRLRDVRRVTSILATHQIRDAFYIATHEAVRIGDSYEVVTAGEGRALDAQFMVLHEGRIQFEGNATELLASQSSYLREFLFMTLPPW